MLREKTGAVTDHDVPTQIKNQKLLSERRRHLVDSTVQLFIAHGYHKTTTRMIAKAAGFSIGSLYEYVSSKEDLLYLVCKAIHEAVRDAVETAMAEPIGEKEMLAEMIRQYFIVCDNMADHISLMYKVTQFLPEKWQDRVLVNELNITGIFIRILGDMSGKHNVPKLDDTMINLVGHNISVLGHMWAFRRWHLKKEYTLDQYIEMQTRFILGLLI